MSLTLSAADNAALTLLAGDPLPGPYDVGATTTLSLFVKRDDELVQPETVACEVISPSSEVAAQMTVTDPATDDAPYTTPIEFTNDPGAWGVRWTTTNPDGAVERVLTVNGSRFYSTIVPFITED